MTADPMATAQHLAQLAQEAIDDNRFAEAKELFEQTYTCLVAAHSALPISFKLVTRDSLPHLASEEHIIANISQSEITFIAMLEFIARPCSDFRRMPMLGHLCSDVARFISGPETYQCVFDTGDGFDEGPYYRFAYSSALPQTGLILDPYLYIFQNYDGLRVHAASQAQPWTNRKNVLFWRGTTTGRRSYTPAADTSPAWDWLPRLHLCAASRASRFADHMDIAITEMGQIGEPHLRQAITSAGLLGDPIAKKDFCDYKYQIDIDGHTNSWSLIEKFIMGSTVFKVRSAEGFRQWYYDRLKDWDTHIPIAADLSDLDEKMEWALTHPAECERIAANGAALAATIQLPAAWAEAQATLIGNWRRI
ncbi:glycosyl transferase family 90 [Telmatospirillum siberiense]|nr:glycosyl transferase family 90 [Telmatospirillum siberiense]